jgi:hypothetical protein
MDPGAAGWRAFWLARARAVQETAGWAGLFLDNVPGAPPTDVQLARYASAADYQTAVVGFLQWLRNQYVQPTGRPLYANLVNASDAVWFADLEYLDGAMLESFALGWPGQALSPAEWEAQLARLTHTQALGKTVLLVAQGDANDQARWQFAWASYLLVNDGRAVFRYSRADAYREVWLDPAAEPDMGAPLGPRYRDGNRWRRDFSHGQVFVNPANQTAEFVVAQPK